MVSDKDVLSAGEALLGRGNNQGRRDSDADFKARIGFSVRRIDETLQHLRDH